MSSKTSKKRELDESYSRQLTVDQMEHMHVKGKLKKYSRMSAQGDETNIIHPANYSDSESDDDILLTSSHGHGNSHGQGHDSNMSHSMHQQQQQQHNRNVILQQHMSSSSNARADEDYAENSPEGMPNEQDFTELLNPHRPSLDQYRTEIAFRLERERNRLETEIKHEKSRNERAKFLDSLQVQKDQVLLQFIQEHLDARAQLLRNIQFIVSKTTDKL